MFRLLCIVYGMFLLSLNLLWAQEVFEQSPGWRSSFISSDEGLSNSAVINIYKDQRGFMWFGTWDGLNRFDGKNIRSYYPDAFDTLSLSNNIIRNILEDQSGNLWIITQRGVDLYSHDQENFRTWFTDVPELSLTEHSLKAQQGPDGNIWVNAYGLGLFRFEPHKGDFLRVEMPSYLETNGWQVSNFYFKDHGLYILQDNTLMTFHVSEKSAPELIQWNQFENHDGGTFENSWFFELNNTGYLARAFRKGGFDLINLQSPDTVFFETVDESMVVTAINPGVDHRFLWIGMDDGNLFRFSPNSGHLESMTSQIPLLSGKRVKIWSVLETTDDLLWVGTDGEGVFRSILKPKPFFQIQRGEASQKQLNHKIVRAIHEDDKGNLWVGTRGNGLNFIPAGNKPTLYYTTANGLTNNAVLSLDEDKHSNIWIGHDGMGIDILERKTGNFLHFPRDLKGAEQLEFGSVYDICIDAFGYVWLATSGYGVFGLDIGYKSGEYVLNNFQHFHSDGLAESLKSNIVYSIIEEKPNILWLATRGAGIYRLNTLTGQTENFSMSTHAEHGLNDNDVLSLHLSENGILWVGSNGGLTRMNINFTPYSFENFTLRNGLPNNTIHAILEDPKGNIWLSTNNGLSMWDLPKQIFINFNRADGLQSNEYTDGAACAGQKTGRFYFGGINGLDWFYPSEINVSERMPQLIFTSFRLYNKNILPGDSTLLLPRNINELDEITLKHHQNFFSFEFTTLNYINPDKTQFRYKLENFNSQWVYAGGQREANFTNVPFGTYRLLVQATNEDAIWSDEVRELVIVIMPPFWRTWPANVLYILFFISVVYSIARYHSKRMRDKQKRTLERLQQEKEKELNRYKIQFFTNLAHEFGTPLTLILASAASLLNSRQNPSVSSELIKTIYQNSRRMQRLIQELLEFRKVDSGKERLRPVKTELVSTIQNIIAVFDHFARENELVISFEPQISELWVKIDAEKVEKIMLNLMSNAFKYTPAGGNIRVILCTEEDKIKIMVSDTGIGISSESLPHIFDGFYQQSPQEQKNNGGFKGIGIGLAYTKSLVEWLGGKVWVQSFPQKGSTFSVLLPLSRVDTIVKKPDNLSPNRLMQAVKEEILNNKYQTRVLTKPDIWTTPRKYHVLVAEDNVELANLLQKMLSEQYNVTIARDGLKAFEIVCNDRIDLVVSDIMMPAMDGLTLCKTIKSDLLTSHIPVILLTARSDIENRIEGLEMGADSYIPKPFHPKHLFVRIEKLLKAREQVSQYFKTNFGTPSYSLQKDFSSRDNLLLEKCIDFICKNYSDENVDADCMASHLALSKAQLYRKIKALTGLTPHGLIKNFRLKKARQLLAEGNYSISDIIFMTGFNNRTYFYRSYKAEFGETPGELNKA